MDLSKFDLKKLACLIYKTLKSQKIDAILVGGACVSIYSRNQYQSFDLDFVTYEEIQAIEKALSKLGFKRKGRCFSHPQCSYLIDFVNPPIAIGQEKIQREDGLSQGHARSGPGPGSGPWHRHRQTGGNVRCDPGEV